MSDHAQKSAARQRSFSTSDKRRGSAPFAAYQVRGPGRRHALRMGVVLCLLGVLLYVRYSWQNASLAAQSPLAKLTVEEKAELLDLPTAIERKASVPRPSLVKPPRKDKRANAAIVMLVRNSELKGALSSMRDLERTFNSKFNYPWIFFNDEAFTEDFKKQTSALTAAETRYEIIPREHWDIPDNIDREILQASFDKLEADGVKYHHLKSYRQMCRWNSGFFFKHPALQGIKWYWRVEPDVHFFCDIDYDVFQFMEMHNKTYGFVISLYDAPKSLRSLWPTVEKFMSEHPEYLHPNNSLHWLQDNARPHHHRLANGYSTCHFWTNFEIANMDFWRSKPYQDYFAALDKTGGFMYERWGDAPVHSIALGLFEDKHKIHFFNDIGYQHVPFFSCPANRQCKGCKFNLTDSPGTGLDNEDCKPVWFDNVELPSKQSMQQAGMDKSTRRAI